MLRDRVPLRQAPAEVRHPRPPARDAVRAALAVAEDPEVVGRLEAVLQAHVLEEEDHDVWERSSCRP